MGFDKRSEIKIVGCTLWFAKAREIDTVSHGLVLQIAFAALVADRAIKRVVDQEKFHHAFTGLFDHGRIGFNNGWLAFWTGAQIFDLHGARCGRFGRATDNFDQTHAAVASNRKPLMIAETRDLDASLAAGLDQGHCPVDLDLISIDNNFAKIRHSAPLYSHCTAHPIIGVQHGWLLTRHGP